MLFLPSSWYDWNTVEKDVKLQTILPINILQLCKVLNPLHSVCSYISELGHYLHPCEDDLVCKCTNEKIPYFNAPVFLENKQQIGKVDEIFGPIRDFVSFMLYIYTLVYEVYSGYIVFVFSVTMFVCLWVCVCV